MNNVVLLGRLTRDPEMRYTQAGMATTRFTLAVDRGLSKEKKQEAESKNLPTADFINIVAWGKLGETCANYLSKGRQVALEGKIRTGSYEKDGQRLYTTDVVVSRVHFINSGENNTGNKNNNGQQDEQTGMGFYPVDNDDIPF